MKALYAIVGIIVGLVVGIAIPRTAPMNHDMGTMNMQHSMNSMTSALEGKSGDAFDRAFLSQMIVHHEGAVVMARQALSASSREDIKSLSQDIIVAQEKEIQQMKDWQSIWFGQ